MSASVITQYASEIGQNLGSALGRFLVNKGRAEGQMAASTLLGVVGTSVSYVLHKLGVVDLPRFHAKGRKVTQPSISEYARGA